MSASSGTRSSKGATATSPGCMASRWRRWPRRHSRFGRPEMPGYMRRAADWIFANPQRMGPGRRVFLNAPVHAVMLTPGLAYIGETSGVKKYWDVALESFRRQTEEGQVTDRLKLFAQLFRNSQRFPVVPLNRRSSNRPIERKHALTNVTRWRAPNRPTLTTLAPATAAPYQSRSARRGVRQTATRFR